MTKRINARRIRFAALSLSLGLLHSTPAFSQQSQSTLAQQLLSSDSVARKAFLSVAPMAKDEIGDELRTALVTLLIRKNMVVADASRRGLVLSTIDDPSFIAALSRKVASLQDPRAISALAEARHGGSTVITELVRFGQAAVPALSEVAASTGKHYDVVNHALGALSRIVESPQGAMLSSQARAQIRGVAEQRLSGQQYFTTLWRAIDLAVALRDSALLRTVELLASDANAVRARGITDEEVVRRTQQRASDRLRRQRLP